MGSFQDLLNRIRTINMPGVSMPTPQEPEVPSQMPWAYKMGVGMGPGIDHGITGNLSDIQNRPFDYGMKGGFKQMPYIYDERDEEQKVLEQLPYVGNTFSLINFLNFPSTSLDI